MMVSHCKTKVDQGVAGGLCSSKLLLLVGGYQGTPSTPGAIPCGFEIAHFIKLLSCFTQVTLESFANPRLITVS